MHDDGGTGHAPAPGAVPAPETPWHAVRAAEAAAALGVDPARGLSAEEARRRLAEWGPNRLPEPRGPGPVIRFLRQFHNILIYVLLGAAALTMALGHFIDAGVILAVVVINAAIGFIQEGRAEAAMSAIRRMLAPRALVLRDGVRQSVDSAEIAPGDIVMLQAGDRVPADLRLIRAHGLQMQEAVLTGESAPVAKHPHPVDADAPLGDRASMAFSGALVVSGAGAGVAVATGAHTEIGRISGMIASVETLTTPLIRQMNIFARWLTVLILLIAGLLLLFGVFVGHRDFAELFMVVVGLSVAAIPEGLPAVLTITLAVGVQAMARRNVVVRRLPAIETLGSVAVICTDKTGTLTRNEMVAVTAATSAHLFRIDGEGYGPQGAVMLGAAEIDGRDHPTLEALARASVLCNDATIRHDTDGWRAEGDPMEAALLALAAKIGLDAETEAAAWPRRDVIPFDASHRFMATLNQGPDGKCVAYVKGAPERILDMCGRQIGADGDAVGLDRKYWLRRAEEIAHAGERVLALARKPMPESSGKIGFRDVASGLELIGLVGLADPPRAGVVEAVAECRRAGVRVKMITGDHKGTAAAIGAAIGLENTRRVLTGADLDRMDDAELAAAVLNTDIFARTSPEHKLRLVTAFQANGLSVAMTGDGVNDAPALKRADAGVAMGLKGSEAAKEAADIVLADDNFVSIVAAIREGRTVYDNIKKVISWTLPTSFGEATTIIVALLLGMALPITPVQILWINLVTATTLGVALAFEPTEADTMRRPPRPRDEPLLSSGLAWQIIFTSALFAFGVFGIYAYAADRGYSVELARTLCMNALVVFEIFYLFFIRHLYAASLTWEAVRGTRVVWLTVAAVVIAQFAVTYFPPLQRLFETRTVPFADGLLILGAGVALFALVETEKQLRLSFQRINRRSG
ncbi:MAG: cation-transporting P-type ATPase [Parvularculaceae bacterium]